MADDVALFSPVGLDDPRVQAIAADELRRRLPDAGSGLVEPLVAAQLASKRGTLRAQHPDAVVELVTVDGVPAGFAVVDGGAAVVRLCDIAVAGTHRARGYGRMLMARVLADADAAGAAVELSVWPGSPAHDWYRRLGFVESDAEDGSGYVQMRRAAAE